MSDPTNPSPEILPEIPPEILIDISTAIMRVQDDALQCRLVDGKKEEDEDAHKLRRLPFGSFMPGQHRTMEISLRQWVHEQVGVDLGHVEQLYTFADQGRHLIGPDVDTHVMSVGYLALTDPQINNQANSESGNGKQNASDWHNIYQFFPWEDWRKGRPDCLDATIVPALNLWRTKLPEAQERVRLAFGPTAFDDDNVQWDEEFVLERYELLYEAGLVHEAFAGGHTPLLGADSSGCALQLDHRRILATALGRLRGKLKYRPVIFDLMASEFTLGQLQKTTEAVIGVRLHKQNFRRLVEKSGFLLPTNRMQRTRGRPAELYRFRHEDRAERPLSGLRISTGHTGRGQ